MTQQQQKSFIASLSMSLEAGHPSATAVATTASQSAMATSVSNITAPTSQLMQQLQQPLDIKQPVNNPSSSVNKSVSIPNAQSAQTTKAEPPQPSPTGNNNKSNINLNHMSQTNAAAANPMSSASSVAQQQHQPMLSSTHSLGPSTSGGNGLPPMTSTTTPSIIQQQLTNSNTNPIQAKHQTAYPMNPMNSCFDPLEQSLASMEQPHLNNNSQKNPSQEMNAMLMDFQHKQMLLNHMTAPHIGHGGGSNGFGTDFNGANGAVNNLMNMLVLPTMDPTSLSFLNNQMKGVPGRFPETWNNLPGNNPMMQSLTAQQQQQQHQSQQQQQQMHQAQQQHQQSSIKQEKIMLTPKPIEELLMNPNDKTKALGGPGGAPPFGQAFNKYEQNLKNASSWSQLAAAGSPQNPGSSIPSKSKVPSTDTFQEYRTKAKEQQQRQKQEQEKMKKQKEQELKRQQESLQKQHKSDDMSNGHRYVNNASMLLLQHSLSSPSSSNDRKPSADPIAHIMEEMRASPASTSPVSAQTQQERTAAARRAEERAAEQERRRREAVSTFDYILN